MYMYMYVQPYLWEGGYLVLWLCLSYCILYVEIAKVFVFSPYIWKSRSYTHTHTHTHTHTAHTAHTHTHTHTHTRAHTHTCFSLFYATDAPPTAEMWTSIGQSLHTLWRPFIKDASYLYLYYKNNMSLRGTLTIQTAHTLAHTHTSLYISL